MNKLQTLLDPIKETLAKHGFIHLEITGENSATFKSDDGKKFFVQYNKFAELVRFHDEKRFQIIACSNTFMKVYPSIAKSNVDFLLSPDLPFNP